MVAASCSDQGSSAPTTVRPIFEVSKFHLQDSHDLRHHAITELAEAQVSDQTIMAIAGHVSPQMLPRYSHVRREARRQAVAALSAKPTGSWFSKAETTGYDKNNDTRPRVEEQSAPKRQLS